MMPAELLRAHHHDVERACLELKREMYGDDRLALIAAWRRFEERITAHMVAEEELLLDAYGREQPDDARAIRAEHARLRSVLTPLGVECELHLIRASTLERLLAFLRMHAEHEDRGLYAWADGALDANAKQALMQRLALLEAA